jgi:hypothetical protein
MTDRTKEAKTDRTNAAWLMVAGVVTMLLVPTIVVASVLVGTRGSDSADAPVRPVTPTVVADTGADSLLDMEATGQLSTMVEQHQAMMDQMRASASPAMLQLMNSDPMWQMMRSGAYTGLLEQHEGDIDRMLARAG